MIRFAHLPAAPEWRTTTGATVQKTHRIIQSVGATGGVYKGQGRNQTHADDMRLLGIPR